MISSLTDRWDDYFVKGFTRTLVLVFLLTRDLDYYLNLVCQKDYFDVHSEKMGFVMLFVNFKMGDESMFETAWL